MNDTNVGLGKGVFSQSDQDSPLKRQNAVVTGASYGIGAQIAAHLAAQGVNLAITARSRDKLDTLARELRTRYRVTVAVIPADLMSERDRDSILKQALTSAAVVRARAG